MAERCDPSGPPADRPTGREVHLLLVDDQPANLLALEAVLADLGAKLVKAHSGDGALRSSALPVFTRRIEQQPSP
jgi:CheY-like chemotaxis protein